MNNGLLQSVMTNVVFVTEFLVIIVASFLIAWIFEKAAKRKNHDTQRILTTRKLVVIGVFSAISAILYILDFPVFFAPGFYRMDFSELPALIGAFAFGPVTGVMIEFIKILVKIVMQGTTTAFVGDLANFVIGCSFVLPASIIYNFKKNRKSALIACITATAVITVVGSVFNAVYLLPTFSVLYGMPMDSLIAAGTAVNGNIKDLYSFVILAVAPMNLFKGALDSLITFLIYKKLSPVLKFGYEHKNASDKINTAQD